ncbi:MAG: class I SAM-dependent methyltransferase [Alphaproteobacteria bacterium]|nr:class I SAM-dependent methyltransferase [Alphaproteobacteria bacterium]MBV9694176.1 class I SAM-dependent methyltransferase [Alphaproteobacteria bacterium]
MRPADEAREARYLKFKAKNPQVPFSRYLMERQYRNMRKGDQAPSGALRIALGSPDEFWQSGRAKAEKLMARAELAPSHKAIEYGCGSLRIGAHFIRFLKAGHFLGLDVIDGFYELGKRALGPELLSAKSPRFHVIDAAGLAMAEAFDADVVFSNVVCVHVHPDETAEYFRNLARLAHKPGARLLFNAHISDVPLRFEFDGWSWPMAFYKNALEGFALVRAELGRPRMQDGVQTAPVDFEFRRPSCDQFA